MHMLHHGWQLNHLSWGCQHKIQLTSPQPKYSFNSIISTPDAHFMAIDVNNFYLNMPMDIFEYMHLPISIISEEIIQQYNLHPL
jgi:hypothetical protein